MSGIPDFLKVLHRLVTQLRFMKVADSSWILYEYPRSIAEQEESNPQPPDPGSIPDSSSECKFTIHFSLRSTHTVMMILIVLLSAMTLH